MSQRESRRPGLPDLARPMLAIPGELPAASEDARWAYEMKWTTCAPSATSRTAPPGCYRATTSTSASATPRCSLPRSLVDHQHSHHSHVAHPFPLHSGHDCSALRRGPAARRRVSAPEHVPVRSHDGEAPSGTSVPSHSTDPGRVGPSAGVAAAGRTVAASARRLLGLLEGDGESGLVAGSNSVQSAVDGGAADPEQLREFAGGVLAARGADATDRRAHPLLTTARFDIRRSM